MSNLCQLQLVRH